MSYVLFASYGNDSIALIQWAYDEGIDDVCVVHTETGWAADWWRDRVLAAEKWVIGLGLSAVTLRSEGMESLVRRKNAWPRGGGGKFQFCTQELKKRPALEWLDVIDPQKDLTCMTGIRRCESRNRANAPEWVTESESHGGRELWSPLVRHSDSDRDALIAKTPFEVLPFRSKECWPCVNAGMRELKHLEEDRIRIIEDLEEEMGVNSKGNARVMFSPKRHNGAVGIRAVVEDARKGGEDMFQESMCNTGWCE